MSVKDQPEKISYIRRLSLELAAASINPKDAINIVMAAQSFEAYLLGKKIPAEKKPKKIK